jgi:ABC-type polysaccharide/polyol phosphate export permease
MNNGASLRNSMAVQLRVIFALLMREVLTRYGRHNIGFLWIFAEPMLFTLGITALWTAFRAAHGSDLPIVAFAITGYSSVLLWRNMPMRCVNAIEPNVSLLYHRNVKILDVFVSRILLEGMGATISFVGLILFFVFIGMMKLPEDVLQVGLGWLMLAWFGASVAVCVGSISQNNDVVERVWGPITYFLFPLSGAAFLVDALPTGAQQVILLLPMVHGVEMLREGYFGSVARFHYDISYMATWCLGLSFVGLAQARRLSRLVMPQ